jgi:hypothetical protein
VDDRAYRHGDAGEPRAGRATAMTRLVTSPIDVPAAALAVSSTGLIRLARSLLIRIRDLGLT